MLYEVAYMDKVLSRILDLMNQKYPSEAAFELALGIKPKSIYTWKTNRSKWYKDNIETIAKYLDVSPAYLMGWEDKSEDDDAYLVVGFGQTGGPKKVRSPKEKAIVALEETARELSVEEIEAVIQFARFTKDQKNKG